MINKKRSHFDAGIICALAEEAEACLEVVSQSYGISFQEGFSERKREYRFTTITNNQGEPLSLFISWLPRYGLLETGLHLTSLLAEFTPRFVGMTGICAGDKRKVHLGDLVVAERTFIADSGKRVVGIDGLPVNEYDTSTFNMPHDILHYVRMFSGWEKSVAKLPRPATTQQDADELPDLHIASMGSTNSVRSDNPFDQIRIPVRGAIALDMEGAAFYRAVEEFPGMRALLVKGVSDYADSEKNDSYHDYASFASALYMLSFIREYVTSDLMPREATETGDQSPSEKSPTGSSGFTQNNSFGTINSDALTIQQAKTIRNTPLTSPRRKEKKDRHGR